MIRVASVPSAHPYVDRLLPRAIGTDGAGGDRAVRLEDPPPPGRTAGDGVWWPPMVLDPVWLVAHADEVDVVHVHFGFESSTTAQLTLWVQELRRAGIPLVATVHDLANPHLTDQQAHLDALGVLVPAAAEVITLTPGVAAVIRERWGREAVVLPHPQIADDAWVRRSDTSRCNRQRGLRVGVPLGAVRANVDPTSWLAPLAATVGELGGTVVVTVNDEVLRSDDARRLDVLAAVEGLASAVECVDLRVRPRLDDDALAAWIAGTDVVVLPYAHGTHSGWLELCWDLGASCLSPAVGHYAEQHDDVGFHAEFDEPEAVGAVLRHLVADRTRAGGDPWQVPWGDAAERLARRSSADEHARRVHEEVYDRVIGAGAAPDAATVEQVDRVSQVDRPADARAERLGDSLGHSVREGLRSLTSALHNPCAGSTRVTAGTSPPDVVDGSPGPGSPSRWRDPVGSTRVPVGATRVVAGSW